jgi:hypothetical protein
MRVIEPKLQIQEDQELAIDLVQDLLEMIMLRKQTHGNGGMSYASYMRECTLIEVGQKFLKKINDITPLEDRTW